MTTHSRPATSDPTGEQVHRAPSLPAALVEGDRSNPLYGPSGVYHWISAPPPSPQFAALQTRCYELLEKQIDQAFVDEFVSLSRDGYAELPERSDSAAWQ